MSESRATVYANAAGLLARMGFVARMEPEFVPPPACHRRIPVPALITDASPVLVGYAVTSVAEDPEAHLPELSARAGRVPYGESGGTPWAWWSD